MVAANPGFVAAKSDPLTLRTYDLFFEAIALFLSNGVTLVAEAAFQHPAWRRGLEPLADLANLRIVRCQVSDVIARERMQARLSTQSTRAAHADTGHLLVNRTFNPVHVDAPILEVDTSDGRIPSLHDIAVFCRA